MGMLPLSLLVACFGLDSYSDPTDVETSGDSGLFFPDAETGQDDSGLHALDDTGTSDGSGPVADAGGDIASFVGDIVSLDGSLSTDPDGDTLEFTWFLVSRPVDSATELINEDRAEASMYLDAVGTYEVQLQVTDGEFFDSDTATITAEQPNGDPVADAGRDQSVTEGDTVTLDGTGSFDPDGDTLTYSWVLISRPGTSLASLSNATTPTPQFGADEAGTYEFELVVSDGQTVSLADGVRVQAQAMSSGGSGGSGGGSSCSCAEIQDEVERRHPLARALPATLGFLPAMAVYGFRRRED
jgi:hypothetical protein